MHTCMHVYTHMHTHTNTRTHTSCSLLSSRAGGGAVRIHIYTHAWHTYIHACMYMHPYIRIHTYRYIDTQTHVFRSLLSSGVGSAPVGKGKMYKPVSSAQFTIVLNAYQLCSFHISNTVEL